MHPLDSSQHIKGNKSRAAGEHSGTQKLSPGKLEKMIVVPPGEPLSSQGYDKDPRRRAGLGTVLRTLAVVGVVVLSVGFLVWGFLGGD